MGKYNLTERKEKNAAYRSLVRAELVDELYEKILKVFVVDKKYRDLDPSVLPLHESLAMTIDRVMPFWHDQIVPAIRSGKKIIIAAHGNSLRALVKYLDNLSEEDICALNIPTAVPLVYDLDENLKPVGHRYLGDQEAIAAAINAVANQTKKK